MRDLRVTRQPKRLTETLQLLNRGPAPLIELDNGDVRTGGKNPSRQSRQHTGRPNLNEHPHALRIELFDDINPADGFSHLPDETLTNRIGSIEPCQGRAADQRELRRTDREPGKRGRQLTGRLSKQWRVKWTGNCQPLAPQPGRFQQEFESIDTASRTTDNCLLRRILSAPPDPPGQGRDRIFDRQSVSLERQQYTIFGPQSLDGIGSSPRCRSACFLVPAPGSGERWELTEAVAGDDVSPEAERGEHLPGKQIAKVHRPLGFPDPTPKSVRFLPGYFG